MFHSQRGLVWMAVAAAYICLIDRIAISVAIIPMVDEYGWQPSDQGAILSAFFIGYVVLQLPAGWLSDRYGGRWVLGLGVLLWSLFTALTPPAASFGLTLLIVCRLLMGMAESVTWPAVYSLFSRCLPVAERGLAVGLLNSSISGGTIIALVATPWLIAQGGWAFVFYVYGGIGLAWAVFWWAMPTPDALLAHPSEFEREGVLDDDLAPFTWRSVLRHREVWALAYAHFATNWLVFLALAWLPTYLSRAFGLDIMAVGLLAVVPYVVSMVATPLFGRWTDRAIALGADKTRWRKRMQALALGGGGAVTLVVGYADNVTLAMALFSLANLCVAASVGGFAANHMDLAPRRAGTLYGATNALASVGAAGSVYVAGWVLELTGQWSAVFQSASLVAFSGAAVFWLAGGTQRLFK